MDAHDGSILRGGATTPWIAGHAPSARNHPAGHESSRGTRVATRERMRILLLTVCFGLVSACTGAKRPTVDQPQHRNLAGDARARDEYRELSRAAVVCPDCLSDQQAAAIGVRR
jgi:hypothetical protein